MKYFRGTRVIARYFLVCFIAISAFSVVAYGQSKIVYLETVLMYNFETLDEWLPISNSSRFIFRGTRTNENGVDFTYPSLRLFASTPAGMGNRGSYSTNSLGASVSFFRKSHNFFDLVPAEQKIIPGLVENLEVWVWGGNYNYTAEMILSDYKGYTHKLPLGSLRYIGWKNLKANVSSHIPQQEPYVPRARGLRFLNFRFTSSPEERPDNFIVLLDYFQAVTDTFSETYDGSDIETKLGVEAGGATADQYKRSNGEEEENNNTTQAEQAQ